jgi:TalC/MipB family fructose-6-phosphate aldolase
MDDFELIIDTADIESIRRCDEILDVQGVTTNPTIITKTGKPAEQAIRDLVEYLRPDQKLFVQVVATDFDGIMSEARHIAQLRPENTYAKIPVTHAGLRAIKQCRNEGIGTLATAIYSSDAAFMAAHNGADYLAAYVNRMCNYGDGVQDVIDLIDMLAIQNSRSKLLAASFKNVDQAHKLILAGAQALTLPPDVALAMVGHPGTQIAVDEFSESWRKAYGRETLLG